MQRLILLLQCNDQEGIVAKVSEYIFENDGNIISLDQYSTDYKGGYFFMRIEFVLEDTKKQPDFKNGFNCIASSFKAVWNIYYKCKKLRMGILVSKPEHCLIDLLYLWKTNEIQVDIPFIISNCEQQKEIADAYNIPFYYVVSSAKDRKEAEILNIVKDKTDFLSLARYMVIFTPDFINKYGKDIINIHHSFLPSFKGAKPYQQAFERGVKVIGATAHFVTENLDDGPIISQMVESVSHKDDIKELERKGKNLEKRAFAHALSKYIDYKVIKHQNKTIVF